MTTPNPSSSSDGPTLAFPQGEPLSSAATPRGGSRGARALARLLAGTGVPCEMVLPSGEAIRCGDGPPRFRVIVRSDRALRGAYDELALGGAYVEGEIDIEGDIWSVF